MTRKPLPGSERRTPTGASLVGPADPSQAIRVTVLLKRPAADALAAQVARWARGEHGRQALSREDFARRFGARPGDIAAIRAFARAHGLGIEQESPERRTVVLTGTVGQFGPAFGVDLRTYRLGKLAFRGRVGPILLPEELHAIVDAVLGLDERPQAKPHFRRRPRTAGAASFTALQLAALYAFPPSAGQGETIGIIELGGGYRASDIQSYFAALALAPPKLVDVPVDGGSNAPTGDPDGPDGEVELDIEVAGAIAPAATIAVYFAPNTDAGFIDAVTTAVHDTVNRPTVLSISWGGPEPSWTQQALTALDQAIQEATALGITVCVAAGDNGSSDGVSGGGDHVDFPASSSYALACGGTSLRASGGRITSEIVWNDGADGGATGGGVSSVFALPTWQEGLQVAKTGGQSAPLARRGVPDVSGNADPDTGYTVTVDGQSTVIGGTSAVAPLWAGLIARVNATRGAPSGLVQPALYAAHGVCNDITQGNNGDFAAAPGWDACTGLGSPDGTAVAAAIQAALNA